MKYIIKIVPFLLLLLLLTSCAAKPVFPWPEFELIEIGDMLCAPTEKDKNRFDQWLQDVDKYIEETK